MTDLRHVQHPVRRAAALRGDSRRLLAGVSVRTGRRQRVRRLDPIGGGAGYGGNAHAANEFYVIEGAGKVYGIAGAEKSIATFLYDYAGKNGSGRSRRPPTEMN